MTNTLSPVICEISKRNMKKFGQYCLNALIDEVDGLKKLRGEAKNRFGWLKLEAKSAAGWDKGGQIEDDFIVLYVLCLRADLRVTLATKLSTGSTRIKDQAKQRRLMASAKLYYDEIKMFHEKAKCIIEEHYALEQEKGKKS